jgi:hypothetical protein
VKSTARAALGHTLDMARPVTERTRRLGVRIWITVAGLTLWTLGLGTGPAFAAGARETGEVTTALPLTATSVPLLAAVVGIAGGLLTARWSRAQVNRDRRSDRSERRERQAEIRAETELRERRIANRTAWTMQYQRIDQLLLDVGTVEYEAHRRRLSGDDREAPELVRLQEVADQYADWAPGALPGALRALVDALQDVQHHLLPPASELDGMGGAVAGGAATAYRPLFIRAGEQTRAADRLAEALKDARSVLLREWGMD